jgi:hypothetical protein
MLWRSSLRREATNTCLFGEHDWEENWGNFVAVLAACEPLCWEVKGRSFPRCHGSAQVLPWIYQSNKLLVLFSSTIACSTTFS